MEPLKWHYFKDGVPDVKFQYRMIGPAYATKMVSHWGESHISSHRGFIIIRSLLGDDCWHVFYWDPEKKYYVYFCSEVGTLKGAKEIANAVNREGLEAAMQSLGLKKDERYEVPKREEAAAVGKRHTTLFPNGVPWSMKTPEEDMRKAVKVFFEAKKKHDEAMLQRISTPVDDLHFTLYPPYSLAVETFLRNLWKTEPICGQGQKTKTNDWEYDIPKPVFIYNLVDDGCVNEYLNIAKEDVRVILRQLLEERDIPISERMSYNGRNTTSIDYFLDEDSVRVASYTYTGRYVGSGILWVNQLQLQPHINIQKESQ